MGKIFHQNKKLVFAAIVIWTVLFLLFITVLMVRISQSGKFVNQLSKKAETEDLLAGWENDTIRNLYKEKWWYEQQIMLAKSDSFSLGINLNDSIVQVQLKGTVLFQAKILKQQPEQFFKNSDEKLYRMLFENISRINSSNANIPKKPIKKVTAPKVGEEVREASSDTTKEDLLVWHFYTDNEIEVVIFGVQQNDDSTSFRNPNSLKTFRIEQGFYDPFNPGITIPLFLWLDDRDAKALYRALPENAKVIFRD